MSDTEKHAKKHHGGASSDDESVGNVAAPTYQIANSLYQESVLKILASSQVPDYDIPWTSTRPQSSFGSGVAVRVMGVKRILTAAHVISDHTFVQVQKTSDPQKCVVRVIAVSHESDLALLEVTEPDFLNDVPEKELGDVNFLPQLRDKVSVVGFPIGGDEVSITEGVVSRVEVQSYSHSARKLLAITVDAAINSGNSGGPVFSGETILGIAVQSYNDAQNIGEIVPAPVVQHFLECYRRGIDNSMPDLGIEWQNMEGSQLRKRFGLLGKDTGVLVTAVHFMGSSYGVIQKNDVLLSIAGQAVCNNGTVRWLGQFRTLFHVLYHGYFVGDGVPIQVLRDGKRVELEVRLRPKIDLVPRMQYDKKPSFFIFGGCIFQPLDRNYLETWKEFRKNAPGELLQLFYKGRMTPDRKQVVVFTNTLPDDINVGYDDYTDDVVETVNGQPVVDLKDFVQKLETSVGHVDIETTQGVILSFDLAEEQARKETILLRYHVDRDRSDDLPLSIMKRESTI